MNQGRPETFIRPCMLKDRIGGHTQANSSQTNAPQNARIIPNTQSINEAPTDPTEVKMLAGTEKIL